MLPILVAVGAIIASGLFWKWWNKEGNTGPSSETKTPYDSKPPVAIHDIVADRNGNGTPEKVGYPNPAYAKTEENPVFVQPLKCSKEELRKPRQTRQISDVSEVFRIPRSDEKSLSELVIEEYDNKSKTLRNGEFADFSAFRSSESLTESDDSSRCDDITASDDVSPPTSAELEHHKESVKRNGNLKEESERIVSNDNNVDGRDGKNTEWRDKLKRDLFDDDDDFVDESSDDDDGDASFSVTSVSDEEDDEKMRSQMNGGDHRTLQSQNSNMKLLHQKPIVIDNGSYCVRAGWAGEFAPIASVRNVIGHWRAEASEAWQEHLGSKFIGETAIERHSTLMLENPIEDGKVQNWRTLQQVWDHAIIDSMNEEVSQHPILVSESATVEKKQREKMVEVFIETLRVPGVRLCPQAVLCSFSCGQKVGIVVNSGHGQTEIVPVYEGYQLPHLTVELPVGGRHITEYLARLVQRERGVNFTSVPEMEIINGFKESHASVQTGRASTVGVEDYNLPDGRVIELGKELTHCTEPLFNPGLVGKSSLGLTQLVKQTLESVEPDLLEESNHNILLSGGTGRLKGLRSRLQEEINSKMEGTQTTLQMAEANAAWIGGSVLAEQSNFPDYCVTEDLYFEFGANVVHRLCMQ
ncbi:unnamed protein product [Clavelina lepadiformis]|uniref:Actin n=1 Tax=Clavelina lepadiformis TaxID=159417 RepID=A0ABP0G9Y9_CLALP